MAIRRNCPALLTRLLLQNEPDLEGLQSLVDIALRHGNTESLASLVDYLLTMEVEQELLLPVLRQVIPAMSLHVGREDLVDVLFNLVSYTQDEMMLFIQRAVRAKNLCAIAAAIKFMRERPQSYQLAPVWDVLFKSLHTSILTACADDLTPLVKLWISIIKAKDTLSIPVLYVISEAFMNHPIYSEFIREIQIKKRLEEHNESFSCLGLLLLDYSTDGIARTLLGTSMFPLELTKLAFSKIMSRGEVNQYWFTVFALRYGLTVEQFKEELNVRGGLLHETYETKCKLDTDRF